VFQEVVMAVAEVSAVVVLAVVVSVVVDDDVGS
jgi:hypothetical protein